MLGSDFAVAAVLISYGAVLGKCSPFQLIIMTLFEIVLFVVNEVIGRKYFGVSSTMLRTVFSLSISLTHTTLFHISLYFSLHNTSSLHPPHICIVVYVQAVDMGDSIFVHTFGAYFGMAVARVIYHSDVQETPAKEKEEPVYHSDFFSMLGKQRLVLRVLSLDLRDLLSIVHG